VNPELEEEMEELREEYLSDLFTNCQKCMDPISGEELLVADLSYSVRLLSVEERYNLRSENELAGEVEDHMIFQSRSGDADDKTIKASADIAKKFGMGAEDVSRDGSTVLLTEKTAFRNFVLLGAPACGKTTLLRKFQLRVVRPTLVLASWAHVCSAAYSAMLLYPQKK
jgi:stage III sporulation protein SpoIIIAA